MAARYIHRLAAPDVSLEFCAKPQPLSCGNSWLGKARFSAAVTLQLTQRNSVNFNLLREGTGMTENIEKASASTYCTMPTRQEYCL